MGNLLDALGVDFKMVFIQAVGFLILLVLMKKFLFGKIKDVIKSRADEIKNTYKKSEDDRSEAARLKEEYQQKAVKADEAAEAKIQAAVDKARDVSDEMLKSAQQAVADEKARANQNIDLERKKALAEVRNQVVDLTILSTSKLIKQSTKRETAERLVDDVIKGVGNLS
ncbi:MAG: F0F1 ATP synthase subunit B [Candidatus Scalindua rubra]|uniref:ATP synthase subunit b n=1 Tax=Candidatus Scalindua brodae TaxID=237368 RepID=A0A0B0EIP8_9BACT|nr:MAG: F0F1 ATP synthase B subunit [Candidatus Scalindua brodae]MBZ0110461.1 F0F1 ATP synthase subunit B [Candidatus Scalindua rubra]TWU36296.1 ATP synthase subunit b, sodium ion specific [Candidatus Brocadiaceae bacterium S225]